MSQEAPPPDPENPTSDASLQRRAASGAAWTMVHTVVALTIGFLVNILMARILGVIDYGRLAILMMVIDIAGITVAMGVGSAVMQFGSRAHALGQRDTVKHFLSRATGFRLLVSAPLVSAAVILIVHVPLPLLITALVFGIWLPSWTSSVTQSLAIENRTATSARVEMGINILVQTTVVIALLTLATADSVWAARTAVLGLGGFFALRFANPQYRLAALRPRVFWKLPREFWHFSIPVGLGSLVGVLAIQRTEILLLDWFSTAETVGLFAMAFGLSGHLFAPVQAMMNPLIPAISSLRAVNAPQVGTAFLRVIRVAATSSAAMMGILAPTLAVLVPALYGPQFAAAQTPVLVLAFVAGMTALTAPMQIFVMARLRGYSTLRTNLVALAADLVVALALIPVIGLWGAVLAKAAMVLARCTWLLLTEAESFGVGGASIMLHARPLLMGMFAGSASYGAGALLAPHLSIWLTAPSTALVGLLLLTAGLRVTRSGLTARDSQVLLDAFPRRVRLVVGPALKAVSHRRG